MSIILFRTLYVKCWCEHYGDVIMETIASQITSITSVYSTVYSDADQRKHQSSVSLAFVRRIHREPVNSPHKWPVTRKMFPFDDAIMKLAASLFNTTNGGFMFWIVLECSLSFPLVFECSLSTGAWTGLKPFTCYFLQEIPKCIYNLYHFCSLAIHG